MMGNRWRAMAAIFTTTTMLAVMLVSAPASAGDSPPVFTKVFETDPIGPGSVSTLTFTIDNTAEAVIADDLAFTDTLPAGMTIATPANVANTCGGTLTAPDGGGAITLVDGGVGAGVSCTISVDVTATATGTNTTGDLTSTTGNSGTATDTLTVDADLPGFTKSFSPSAVDLGERSTLTLTVDNSASSVGYAVVRFTDLLPPGMVVAGPSNASSSAGCEGALVPDVTLIADPGTDLIDFSTFGATALNVALAAGDTCTVSVDVIATASGTLGNTTGQLLVDEDDGSSDPIFIGTANATLDVTVEPLHIIKDFTDDPIPPGAAATLEFTILNRDRFDSATAVAFTDTFPAAVTLATPANPSSDCGGTLTALDGGTTVTLASATIPAEGSCTITVDVTSSTVGVHTNTSGSVTATVGGSAVVGNAATENLYVVPAPILTKEFTDDPVAAGEVVTLHFEIEDTTPSGGSTDIAFIDELTTFLPDLTALLTTITVDGITYESAFQSWSAVPPAGTSGTVQYGDGGGGNLDGCAPFTPGTLTGLVVLVDDGTCSTTEKIQNIDAGGAVAGVVGLLVFPFPFPADTPFAGGPVPSIPGFQISLPDATAIKGQIGGPGIATLEVLDVGVPPDDFCGTGSSIEFVSLDTDVSGLAMSGGSLASGATCMFDVSIPIPVGFSNGTYTNTTEPITATVGSETVLGGTASDDLVVVAGPTLVKEFTTDPIAPGDSVTLEFTLAHDSDAPADATGITFTDDLTFVSGLTAATPLPDPDPDCGAGSTLTASAGDTLLTFAGGVLSPGTSCTFSVTLDSSASSPQGLHENTTSEVSAMVAGKAVTELAATDTLAIADLVLTKEFTDDPVLPGDPVTLEFTITNNSSTDDATSILFDDDIDSLVPGITVSTPLPLVDPCGTGSTFLFVGGPEGYRLLGGSVLAGAPPCTFSIVLDVPSTTPLGTYPNTTTSFLASIGGSSLIPLPNASDELVVAERLITPRAAVVTEGDVVVDVPVTLSLPAPPGGVTVDWETLDTGAPGIATADADYVADSGVLTFAEGETTATVPIMVLEDDLDEPPLFGGEWGLISFSSPSAGAVIDVDTFFGLGLFIIFDDDDPLVISPGVIAADDDGTKVVDVPVTLSRSSTTTVTAEWTTLDLIGVGLATEGVDFEAASGTVTFLPGETMATVPITVLDDSLVETPLFGGEWALIQFSDPSPNAVLDDIFFGLGILVIFDDE